MRELRRLIRSFAPYDIPLLLEGEEGTGKRLVAEVIHSLSQYRTGPFVSLDCAALPEMMLAVELFGCEPGFFVGLAQVLPGKVELARDGTLLLEHVEMIPAWIQGRLLQTFATRSVERMGGVESVPVHVRIMASTTGCLSQTAPGQSHNGLIDYLSGGVPLKAPPLRERAGDISLLSCHFLAQATRESGKRIEGFSRAALAALESYAWPGNLRELNRAIRLAASTADRIITPKHIPLYARYASPQRAGSGGAARRP
nr:sigma-54-dependent Fis family transcriptional regulator [Nitrospirota bacterium]